RDPAPCLRFRPAWKQNVRSWPSSLGASYRALDAFGRGWFLSARVLRKNGRQETSVFQAVIWDFGGVFTSSPFEAFSRYEREKGLPPHIIRQINGANHLENAWAKFERAEGDLDG